MAVDERLCLKWSTQYRELWASSADYCTERWNWFEYGKIILPESSLVQRFSSFFWRTPLTLRIFLWPNLQRVYEQDVTANRDTELNNTNCEILKIIVSLSVLATPPPKKKTTMRKFIWGGKVNWNQDVVQLFFLGREKWWLADRLSKRSAVGNGISQACK